MLSGKVTISPSLDQNSSCHCLVFQTVFDELPQKEMEEARARSNVYETIGQSIFLNRYSGKLLKLSHLILFVSPERQ